MQCHQLPRPRKTLSSFWSTPGRAGACLLLDRTKVGLRTATNTRSQNGEITDPPVATAATPEAPTYVHRSASPRPPAEQVFCQKCLNNQHLYISSLAQYLPDDPNDPEYAERERCYYRFRRGLEARYPQVCANCEPKVREKLDKSIYHAKADHLRRMVDRSAQTRVLTTPTAVHYFHSAANRLWTMSYFFQLLWHLLLIQQAVMADSDDFDGKSWALLAARTFDLFAGYLPTPASAIRWSFWTSALCLWWNPKWVEVSKGFDKHLFGFKQYYFYQTLILILKLPAFLNLDLLPPSARSRVTVQVVAHVSMALFMYFLYHVTCNSIRTDHSPLWELRPSSIGATLTSQPAGQRQEPGGGGEQSMADILDEILREPAENHGPDLQPFVGKYSSVDQFDHMPTIGKRSSYDPSAARLSGNPFNSPKSQTPQSTTTGFGLGGLSISERPQTRAHTRSQVQYQSEMEWTPTQSQHRAFSTYQPGKTQNSKFGETPTHERAGVFWAKIPPAPTTPAQRVFNPPNAPRIRTTPVAAGPVAAGAAAATPKNTFGFQGSRAGGQGLGGQPQPRAGAGAAPPTIFAQPTFLPPPPRDERDTLSELFKRSFTLDASPEGEVGAAQYRRQTLVEKMKYLVLGLGLAVVANRAYNYLF